MRCYFCSGEPQAGGAVGRSECVPKGDGGSGVPGFDAGTEGEADPAPGLEGEPTGLGDAGADELGMLLDTEGAPKVGRAGLEGDAAPAEAWLPEDSEGRSVRNKPATLASASS